MTQTDPFDLLLSLARRSQAFARRLPERSATQTHWTGLGFSLLSQRFVVPLEEVAEQLLVPNATKLPGVKNFVAGIANVRGRLITIMDLSVFFGERSQVPAAQRRILVVEEEDKYFGLMVDGSLGLQHFPADSFTESVEDVDERFLHYVTGSYKLAGTTWPVLSVVKLCNDHELEKLAG